MDGAGHISGHDGLNKPDGPGPVPGDSNLTPLESSSLPKEARKGELRFNFLLGLARSLERKERFHEAEIYLKDSLVLARKNFQAGDRKIGKVLHQLSELYDKAGRYEDSPAVLKQYLDFTGKNDFESGRYSNLAQAYSQSLSRIGKKVEAGQALLDAAEFVTSKGIATRQNREIAAHLFLTAGMELEVAGVIDKARQSYSRIVELFGRSPMTVAGSALFRLASISLGEKRFADAFRDYSNSLDYYDCSSKVSAQNRFSSTKGAYMALLGMNEPAQARALLDKESLFAGRTDDIYHACHKGLLLILKGRDCLKPESIDADCRGAIVRARKLARQAIRVLREYQPLRDQYEEDLWEFLGELATAQGRLSRASACYARAVDTVMNRKAVPAMPLLNAVSEHIKACEREGNWIVAMRGRGVQLQLVTQLTGEDSITTADCLGAMADDAFYAGDRQSARKAGLRALRIYRGHEANTDEKRAKVHSSLGLIQAVIDDIPCSSRHYRAASALFSRADGRLSGRAARQLLNLAGVLSEAEKFKAVMHETKKILDRFEPASREEFEVLAAAYRYQGGVYTRNGKFNKGLSLLGHAEKIMVNHKLTETAEYAVIENEKGCALLRKAEGDGVPLPLCREALECFSRAETVFLSLNMGYTRQMHGILYNSLKAAEMAEDEVQMEAIKGRLEEIKEYLGKKGHELD